MITSASRRSFQPDPPSTVHPGPTRAHLQGRTDMVSTDDTDRVIFMCRAYKHHSCERTGQHPRQIHDLDSRQGAVVQISRRGTQGGRPSAPAATAASGHSPRQGSSDRRHSSDAHCSLLLSLDFVEETAQNRCEPLFLARYGPAICGPRSGLRLRPTTQIVPVC